MPRDQDELVLFIDDGEVVRQIVSETLESFGYRVLTAADAAEAVSLYAAQQAEIGHGRQGRRRGGETLPSQALHGGNLAQSAACGAAGIVCVSRTAGVADTAWWMQ